MSRSLAFVASLLVLAPAARAQEATSLSGIQEEGTDVEVEVLDANDPKAKEGEVVGSKGADPGWKNPWVAERSPNIYGQQGLRRVTSADPGKSGYFDIQLNGRGFYMPDFINPAPDIDIFAQGFASFGVSLFNFVELSLATQAASNENELQTPRTVFTVGDIIPSLKLGFLFAPVAVGVDVRALLPTSADAIGPDLDNFAISSNFLLTLDLYEAWSIPFRMHLNGGYTYQNARFASNPQRYYLQGLGGQLLAMTTSQWYYDQGTLGLGVELPFPFVTLYTEVWAQAALFMADNAGVDGGPYDFVRDTHIIATPGLRFSLGRGLHFDLAADFGVGGTGGFFSPDVNQLVAGQPPNPAYAVHLGVSYTFSPFVAQTQVELRERGAAPGLIAGCAADAEAKGPIQEAYVEFVGKDLPRVVVNDDGCFPAMQLSPGEVTVAIKHPDYKPGSVTVTVVAGETARADLALVPQKRPGKLWGSIKSSADEVLDGTVQIVGATGEPQTLETKDGAFATELATGKYQVLVKVKGHLQQGASVEIAADGQVERAFVLKPTPKKRITKLTKERIELKTRIPFELNNATLLKAAEFILDDVVDRILANPKIKKVRIEGHTDDTGKADADLTLSEQRAKAVLDYLVSKGVSASRLESKGFGATKPLPKKKKDRGKAKDRRVEFILVGDAPAASAEDAEAPGGDGS
jgi:outer membrane protein OmpA-like peptidoglycan-associated protein